MVKRYECDVDYRLLHECVSDIFALCLEFDIENFIITRTMTIMMITAWRLPKRLPFCLPSLIIICCQNHASEKGMVVFVVLTD
ncbi:hypothetical protein EV2_037295 [Malus domestica]